MFPCPAACGSDLVLLFLSADDGNDHLTKEALTSAAAPRVEGADELFRDVRSLYRDSACLPRLACVSKGRGDPSLELQLKRSIFWKIQPRHQSTLLARCPQIGNGAGPVDLSEHLPTATLR
jgi:hypothetical protein